MSPDPGQVRLLYAKSKVYVHASSRTSDSLAGWLALVEKPGDGERTRNVLVAWIPEATLKHDLETYVKVEHDMANDVLVAAPYPAAHQYSFSLPLRDVHSILFRPPRTSWWHGSIVINTRSGESYPVLYFHDKECESTVQEARRRAREGFDPYGQDGEMFWGAVELYEQIQLYAPVEKSTVDPHLVLVDPSKSDLAIPEPLESPPASASTAPPSQPYRRGMVDAKWNVLEKFSRLTALGRRAAERTSQHLLSNNALSENLPPQLLSLLRSEQVKEVTGDFDMARVYLATWAMGIEEQAEKERKRRVAQNNQQITVWPRPEEVSDVGSFEVLNLEDADGMLRRERDPPLSPTAWKAMFDSDGRLIISIKEVLSKVFGGGVDSCIRSEVWPFLLILFPWDSSSESRKALEALKREEYNRLKAEWYDMDFSIEGNLRDQRRQIEKDVHRTDRHVSLFEIEDINNLDPESHFVNTNVHLEMMKDILMTYNVYNSNLGYVQGMSDLLSVIYAVLQDDALCFWGFVGYMDRMQQNFVRDQSGMRRQLMTLDSLVQFMLPKLYKHLETANSTNFFFFFRMLLVWFKREFEWEDVQRIWEVCWTDYLTRDFHIFIALAILDRHKDVIIDHLRAFDEILKYINNLSMTMNVDDILLRAESLFLQFRNTVHLIDRKAAENPKDSMLLPINDLLRDLLAAHTRPVEGIPV